MTKKEEIEMHFRNDLKIEISNCFDSMSTYRGYNILNRQVVAGSVFEKNKLCSDLRFHSNFEIPLDEIMLGDINELRIPLNVLVGAVRTINRHEGKLNIWSSEGFDVNPTVFLEYDSQNYRIIISKVDFY